jgi:hypothetical protein
MWQRFVESHVSIIALSNEEKEIVRQTPQRKSRTHWGFRGLNFLSKENKGEKLNGKGGWMK